MLPPHLAHLPPPSAEALTVSTRLEREIRAAIEASGGWLSFARFMELALYAPGLGYYSAGSTKLGRAGDFVTAPEFSSLFGRTLARQIAQLIATGLTDILEVGAGSGALAADLLLELDALGALPQRYLILEVSAELRERQRARLAQQAPRLLGRVQWLDVLPARLEAIVIGNEVLDAIPTHAVRTTADGIDEMGVVAAEKLERGYRAASGELAQAAEALALSPDYETEINLTAQAFVKSFGRLVKRGALVLFDYGFPAAEYYHPQRSRGTLMCHYRHHAHDDPFVLVGLQDITAHVDFTAIARAAVASGLAVLGYATQAQFLVNCGITDILSRETPENASAYAPLAAQAQKLLSPAEMGELFKVIVLAKDVAGPLIGFTRGDRSHTL